MNGNNLDNFEISLEELTPEEVAKVNDIAPDYEFIAEKALDKLKRFYNLDI